MQCTSFIDVIHIGSYLGLCYVSRCVILGLFQVLCRDFTPVKPDPAPVLHICEKWDLPVESVVVVGDHSDDVKCGHKAGAGMYWV